MMKIKVVNGSDIRVFHYTESNKYAALLEFIVARFSLAQSDYSLYYVDDEGDNVTLSTEEEFNDALSIAQEEDRKSLKLFINRKAGMSEVEPGKKVEEPVISSTIDDDDDCDIKNDELDANQAKGNSNSNNNRQDASPQICDFVRGVLPEFELVDAYWAPGQAAVSVDMLPPFDSPHGWRGHHHGHGRGRRGRHHEHPPHWHRHGPKHHHGGRRHGPKFGKCGKWQHRGQKLGHGHGPANGQGHRFTINATMTPLTGTNSQLMADVVKSISLKDGTYYPLDTVLSKVWRVKNNGFVEWGNNVQLVFLEGEESMLVERRFPVPNLKPGEKCDVTAVIKTPSTNGRYQVYFKLQRSGDFFGPKLWADIYAVDENGIDAATIATGCKRGYKQRMATQKALNKKLLNKDEVRQMRLAKMEAKLENRQMKLQAKNMKLVNDFENLSMRSQEMNAQKSSKKISKLEKKSKKLNAQMAKMQLKMDKLEEKKLEAAVKISSNSNSNSNSNNNGEYEATVVIMAEDESEGSSEDFMVLAGGSSGDERDPDDVPNEQANHNNAGDNQDLVQPVPVHVPVHVPAPEPVEVDEAQVNNFAYVSELNQLDEMGFPTDDETCALLVRHKGNIDQVIHSLFS